MYSLTRKVAPLSIVLTVVFTLMLAFSSAQPVNAYSKPSSDEQLVEELLQYAQLDATGNIQYFDISEAVSDKADSAVIDAAKVFNSSTFSADQGSSVSGVVSPQWGIPVHGNWCGPGHSGPAAPIDLLDTRCQTHDRCYATQGYFNKACDRQLVASIALDLSQSRYSWWVATKARAIMAVFVPNGYL